MSGDRDVSEVILESWTSLLRRKGIRAARETALEQLGIARMHGVRFAVPAHWHDPNADHRNQPQPGDAEAGLIAALAALGKGLCRECGGRYSLDGRDRIELHEISDDGHPPLRPCRGGGQLPRGVTTTDEQEQHREH